MAVEDLVPTGGAYGDRQANVAAMQQADLPLASSPSRPPQVPGGTGGPLTTGSPPPSGAPLSGLDLLMGRTPADFPFVNDAAAPAPGPGQVDSPLTALAASSQSTFGSAVLARLASRG
jgi:hypothetical protein